MLQKVIFATSNSLYFATITHKPIGFEINQPVRKTQWEHGKKKTKTNTNITGHFTPIPNLNSTRPRQFAREWQLAWFIPSPWMEGKMKQKTDEITIRVWCTRANVGTKNRLVGMRAEPAEQRWLRMPIIRIESWVTEFRCICLWILRAGCVFAGVSVL